MESVDTRRVSVEDEGVPGDMKRGRQSGAFIRDDEGATLLEYMLLAGIIALVCVISLAVLGTEASLTFSIVGSSFQGNG